MKLDALLVYIPDNSMVEHPDRFLTVGAIDIGFAEFLPRLALFFLTHYYFLFSPFQSLPPF